MAGESKVDHDRLFKELLSTFFVEFLDLFLPQVLSQIECDSIQFLPQEVFTDVTFGEKKEIDLLAQVRYQQQDTCFLIHVENQSYSQSSFAKRMFKYFARLHEKSGRSEVLLLRSPLRTVCTNFQVHGSSKSSS